MNAIPSPTELMAPIKPDRDVEQVRNLYCEHYEACLDVAVEKGWGSWSCTSCHLFGVVPQPTVAGRYMRRRLS